MTGVNKKVAHLMYMPMTGLGLYNGHRGNRWLKNRIKIFKQFVIPSLLNQTSKNFILWASFRYEDKNCPIIKQFKEDIEKLGIKTVFTFSGVCFWDDKYEDSEARDRLTMAIHGAMGDLLNVMDDPDEILMSIQPSDDCYVGTMVEDVQRFFKENEDVQAVGYKQGYVMDYMGGRLAEWNPKTNPPFYTIRFPKDIFIEPFSHMKYTGPYKSHEYVGDNLKMMPMEGRGFLVGTHGDNISTVFDHPYTKGDFKNDIREIILEKFGIDKAGKLKIPFSLRSKMFHHLPYKVKRKLRYLSGEKKWILRPLFAWFYNFMRA